MFLKDITYTIEGNQQLNCIELFGDQMYQLKQFQKIEFKFPIDEDVQFALSNCKGALDEDDLYSLSLKIQPLLTEEEKKPSSSPFLFKTPLQFRRSASNLQKITQLNKNKKEPEEKEKTTESHDNTVTRTKSQTSPDEKHSLIRSISRRARSFVHGENDSIDQVDIIQEAPVTVTSSIIKDINATNVNSMPNAPLTKIKESSKISRKGSSPSLLNHFFGGK